MEDDEAISPFILTDTVPGFSVIVVPFPRHLKVLVEKELLLH